jgi:two-component system, cell cycle sensor histidine kinase and response regulator CckA
MNRDSRIRESDAGNETIGETGFSPADISAGWVHNFTGELKQTVLVVEDDVFIQKAICEALESAGYNVLAAACAVGAKQVYKRYPESVDLLLTDVVLPGTNGRELAGDLVNLSPELRVLLMSGYIREPGSGCLADHHRYHGERYRGPYIEKPFSASMLLRKVSQILNDPLELREHALT